MLIGSDYGTGRKFKKVKCRKLGIAFTAVQLFLFTVEHFFVYLLLLRYVNMVLSHVLLLQIIFHWAVRRQVDGGILLPSGFHSISHSLSVRA